MDAIKSLVQPLVGGAGGSGVIDGMKLVMLGGTVETARRVSSSAWSHFVNSFFLTAHFSEEDYPYDWLMLWLSRRPEWQRSREFETTTRSTTPGFSSKVADNSFGDEDFLGEDGEDLLGLDVASVAGDDDAPGRVKTRVVFQPTFDMAHTIYYRGHLLRVKRSRKNDGCELLSISVVARSNTILKQLVLQAKREYEAEAIHRIQIYFADSHGSWRWTDSRHKRPMGSIVLNPGVKEMLLSDTKDFLASEKWYADRGIPFRRGYLLHGVPGSGKSSLIHAIAGELMLDIYVVSLSSSWISDSTLTTLMGRVPARCILLLEDLDAAFTRSVTRDEEKDKKKDKDSKDSNNNDNSGSSGSSGRSRRRRDDQMSDTNTLSLSGLLNALDGVAAAEGRILFATTNHLERLDPALSRPGRMDVWVEFRNASKWQAEALFRNFFPSAEDKESSRSSSRSSRSASVASNTTTTDGFSQSSSRPASMVAPPDEEVALTKEEEDELSKFGIQLPSPPSEISVSPTPSTSSLPGRSTSASPAPPHPLTMTMTAEQTTIPPPPRTTSSTSFSSWSFMGSSPPATPSSTISSISSALWSLPSLASSTASLLSGGGGGGAAHSAATGAAVVPGRNKTPKALQHAKSPSSAASSQFGANNQSYLPPPVEETIAKAAHSAKPLDKDTLNRLARKFADAIPEEEFSVAALQGYLLKNKSRPEEAADEAMGWVLEERRIKSKLEREKEERKVKRERRKKDREEEETKKEKEEERKKKEEERKKAEVVVDVMATPATAEVLAALETVSTTTTAVAASPSPSPPPADTIVTTTTTEPVPAAPAPVQAEPAVVSLPETPEESDSESSSDDSDEENLPPGVRSRAVRANPPVRSSGWGDGWTMGDGWN
ncbi:hypothetical protein E1B28_000029 [Marasmius oreades]|uniref:P-loop containing nucleoside triphosphate hydrolase protein n=1 Tax=Marasmius oreades TaxID=181124 RepID=A0A9P8AE72_9AGAR|nr:uncharacterized protein E1B28_000029 [Marasmius oreades]KAG7098055.1 hypothetical protein E1B28_000029 [Marasmius oreades]